MNFLHGTLNTAFRQYDKSYFDQILVSCDISVWMKEAELAFQKQDDRYVAMSEFMSRVQQPL